MRSLKRTSKVLFDVLLFLFFPDFCWIASTSTGDDASLGNWCGELRVSYKKMQNNQEPRTTLSDEQIQRLNDAGFKWSLRKAERFNDLMAFKAKYGHCDVVN